MKKIIITYKKRALVLTFQKRSTHGNRRAWYVPKLRYIKDTNAVILF